MRKRARVTLSWIPSVSLDVVGVNVHVVMDGEDVFDTNLTPDVSEVVVGHFDAGASLTAVVTVTDGTYSVPASTSFQVPDLEEPLPVTELGWNYEVIEE